MTGAARGMGRLHAERALAAGASAVLWDSDGDALAATAAELRAAGGEVHAQIVDVGDPVAVADAADAVLERHGPPRLVVNNAGVVRAGWSWEVSAQDAQLVLQVNALAPIHLVRALMPAMIADTSARRLVLTIASASGTVPVPRMSAYAASKWALIGWSESLRLELALAGHRHVGVTVFCPSFVSTGMFTGARGPRLTPVMTPERAVAAAWAGMAAGSAVVMAPRTVRLAAALRAVLPTAAFDVLAGPVFGVHSSM